jgi:hypothetical protein
MPNATLSYIDEHGQVRCLGFSGDESKLLLRIAERVARGREVYGQFVLDSDRRDFEEERREELLDALVYGAMRDLRRAR